MDSARVLTFVPLVDLRGVARYVTCAFNARMSRAGREEVVYYILACHKFTRTINLCSGDKFNGVLIPRTFDSSNIWSPPKKRFWFWHLWHPDRKCRLTETFLDP